MYWLLRLYRGLQGRVRHSSRGQPVVGGVCGEGQLSKRQSELSAAALVAAGVALDVAFLDRPDDDLLEGLAVEYSHLFVGPGRHIPPYASVQTGELGGELCGPSTRRLRNFIETTSLAYQSSYTGVADHICVELEFMAKLIELKAAAEVVRGTNEVSYCRDLERNFIGQFLVSWVPEFCRKVTAEADEPFYRQIADLTAWFIESERQSLTGLH